MQHVLRVAPEGLERNAPEAPGPGRDVACRRLDERRGSVGLEVAAEDRGALRALHVLPCLVPVAGRAVPLLRGAVQDPDDGLAARVVEVGPRAQAHLVHQTHELRVRRLAAVVDVDARPEDAALVAAQGPNPQDVVEHVVELVEGHAAALVRVRHLEELGPRRADDEVDALARHVLHERRVELARDAQQEDVVGEAVVDLRRVGVPRRREVVVVRGRVPPLVAPVRAEVLRPGDVLLVLRRRQGHDARRELGLLDGRHGVAAARGRGAVARPRRRVRAARRRRVRGAARPRGRAARRRLGPLRRGVARRRDARGRADGRADLLLGPASARGQALDLALERLVVRDQPLEVVDAALDLHELLRREVPPRLRPQRLLVDAPRRADLAPGDARRRLLRAPRRPAARLLRVAQARGLGDGRRHARAGEPAYATTAPPMLPRSESLRNRLEIRGGVDELVNERCTDVALD